MTDYTITFSKKIIYSMEISAKDEDAAEEKFWKKVEKFSEGDFVAIEQEQGEIEIESIE